MNSKNLVNRLNIKIRVRRQVNVESHNKTHEKSEREKYSQIPERTGCTLLAVMVIASNGVS